MENHKMSKYKNPPIIEAVFEIRFPTELSIECRKDEYYAKIRSQYPNIFLPKIIDPEPYPLKNYRFENNDGSKLIQFCINRFSFHCKRYETFQKFKEESLKYTDLFCKHYNITKLKRTGLRYVNHIPIKRERGIIPLSKYLKFGYILPEAIPNEMELFHTVLLTKVKKGRLRVLIRSEEVGLPERVEVIVLDFDFFFEGDLIADNLQDYLEESHLHTKGTFESLISDEYKNMIEMED